MSTLLESQIEDALWRYVSPFIILIGIVGNVLSFLVMSRKTLQGSVTSLYLRVLAVVDSMVLITGLLRQWIRVLAVDIRDTSVVICKTDIFLLYWSLGSSAWILSLIAIERCFGVLYPHHYKRCVTERSATVVLVFILVILSCLYIPILVVFDLISKEHTTEDTTSGIDLPHGKNTNLTTFMEHSQRHYLNFTYLIEQSQGNYTNITGYMEESHGNYTYFADLDFNEQSQENNKSFKDLKEQSQMNNKIYTYNDNNTITSEEKICLTTEKDFINHILPNTHLIVACLLPFLIIISCNITIISRLAVTKYKGIFTHLKSRSYNMIFILILVSVYFLIMTSPSNIYEMLYYQWDQNIEKWSDEFHARMDTLWAVVNLLMYMNSAGNFFLYCLSGPRFRNQLTEMFCGKINSRSSINVTKANLTTAQNESNESCF